MNPKNSLTLSFDSLTELQKAIALLTAGDVSVGPVVTEPAAPAADKTEPVVVEETTPAGNDILGEATHTVAECVDLAKQIASNDKSKMTGLKDICTALGISKISDTPPEKVEQLYSALQKLAA